MTTARGRQSPFDIALGNRLRQLRLAAGMSQTKLGNALGVSFQQVQKYENGTNAIASSHIAKLCKALCITPDQLFAVNNAESRQIAELSNYAIRMSQRLDRLSTEQKRAITALLTSFGVDDDV